MSTQEILAKMQELIAEQFAVDADEITMETSFEDDLGADSVDLVELIMAMEEEFDVGEVAEDDLAELKKKLITDPECLSGDRAEAYKEFLDTVDSFCGKVADAAILLRDEASKRNERFNLEVDFKKIDAKAQDSLTKAKATRAKKLNGQ